MLAGGEKESLDPMTPFERKIVHDAVAGVDGVVSESEGAEPKRRVDAAFGVAAIRHVESPGCGRDFSVSKYGDFRVRACRYDNDGSVPRWLFHVKHVGVE